MLFLNMGMSKLFEKAVLQAGVKNMYSGLSNSVVAIDKTISLPPRPYLSLHLF